MNKFLISSLVLTSAAMAVPAQALTKPAFDTGSTSFYYSRLTGGYQWTTYALEEGETTSAPTSHGPKLGARFAVFEDAIYLKGGFEMQNQRFDGIQTDVRQNNIQLGAGLRLPIAMDMDFKAEFDYNFSNTRITTGGVGVDAPSVNYPGLEAGLLFTTDAGLFAAASYRIELPTDNVFQSLHSEVGFKATPNLNISGIASLPLDFESTSFGLQAGYSF